MSILYITATERLGRQLRDGFANQQATQIPVVVPLVMTVKDWLQQCWTWLQATVEHPILSWQRLNSTQEAALWQQIVAEANPEFLRPSSAAQQAKQAWNIWQQWRMDLQQLQDYSQEDILAFLGWAQQFQQHLEQHKWLSEAQLAGKLAEVFQECSVPNLWAEIKLCGFDDRPPALQHLLNVCEQRGIAVSELAAQTQPRLNALLQRCETPEAELTAAALWAQQKLNEPNCKSIGVVVLDLGERFAEVNTIFTRILAPQALQIAEYGCDKPFNISSGQPLAQVPVIFDALESLKLAISGLDTAELAALITTPYWAEAERTLMQRSQLAAKIRQTGQKGGAQQLDQLKLFPPLPARPKLAVASFWAEYFAQILINFGWPGERSLDSLAYQATQHWLKAVDKFASCDLSLGAISAPAALVFLQQIVAAELFQGESQQKPIQVLGLLEAAGLSFDALWVSGLHQSAWPAAPKPNPFLPRDLQRSHNMPHASFQRELGFAQRITDRLQHAAPEVIMSYAAMDGESVQTLSPLIKHLPFQSVQPEEAPSRRLEDSPPQGERGDVSKGIYLDSFTDQNGLPLPTEHTSGGATIFKNQAQCPFKAYAIQRLNACAPLEGDLGLEPVEKGNLLHSVLEKLWKQLKTQAALLALSTTAETALVAECVHSSISEQKSKIKRNLPQRHWQLEAQRLQKIIGNWLQVERERPEFMVQECEHKLAITIGPLTVDCKLDRVDALADGELMVIDYKTGKVDLKDWDLDKFYDPQLPLYACSDDNIIAIAFAELRADENRLRGIAAYDVATAGVVELQKSQAFKQFNDWPQLKQAWLQRLTALAIEYCNGYAAVQPVDPKVCDKCDLHMLCRIHQFNGEDEE